MDVSKKKKLMLLIFTPICIVLILYICVFDSLSHGFYCSRPEYSDISAKDLSDKNIDLTRQSYSQTFIPQRDHFAGFEILLLGLRDNGMDGEMVVQITDEDQHVIEEQTIPLADFQNRVWRAVYTKSNLKYAHTYAVTFSAVHADAPVVMPCVTESYNLPESVDGNALLAYAYSNCTFSFPERALIAIFLAAIWLVMAGFSAAERQNQRLFQRLFYRSGIFLFLTASLAWIYMFNSIDNKNSSFATFQHDSESLVVGMIKAQDEQIEIPFQYGLGTYSDAQGFDMTFYDPLAYVSNGGVDQGYSMTAPAIVLVKNGYTQEVAIEGNTIEFANGKSFRITKVVDSDYREVYLDAEDILTSSEYGSLDDARFYDAQGNILPAGKLSEYMSQYGLQGKIFSKLYVYARNIRNLNLLCALATGGTFSLLVLLIRKKYGLLMAGCFFTTFLLSPWIVNFARNLYWVEFTWFLPMAAGLVCNIWIDRRSCRMLSYAAIFLSIFVKCLCGYEYITAVMLGAISFLLVDLGFAWIGKDRQKAKQIFGSIVIIGFLALAAFLSAIVLHAQIRGDGNIMEGIKSIIEQDALRRTNGGNINEFPEDYYASINASVWETVCRYFHFPTQIIAGIEGNCFSVICVLPIVIMIYNLTNKRCGAFPEMLLYVVFFVTSISWFTLAKSHSYVHTPLNYVLWYFGFVQMCFYIIARQCVRFVRGNRFGGNPENLRKCH